MQKIRLWSIQTIEAWDELNQKGFLVGSKQYVEQEYLEGYEWMRQKMIEKIGKPKSTSQYPLWAWYQHYDKSKKKPDLRKTGHLPKGVRGVRIEFTANQKDVLLSDFLLWDLPLFYKSFIGDTEKEYEEFDKIVEEKKLTDISFHEYPKHLKEKIINSWEKIFDLNFNDSYFTTTKENKMIQACFWELDLKQVIRIDKFIAR